MNGDEDSGTRPGSFPLRGLVELVMGSDGELWRVKDDEFWCFLTPRDYPERAQGWKLHVSATPTSAPLVLHRVAEVLVRRGCAFKFARSLDRVTDLTSARVDRAQAGKFITAYPLDDDHFRELAPLLDEATAGIAGPAILSDRPWRDGSLVHYRYGAFKGVSTLTNDGIFQVRVRAPDGTLVKDVRNPWFSPPRWTELPVAGPPGREQIAPAEPVPVLLNGRYAVRKAIRHSARGGVFLATDKSTGEQVIIKQARPHITGMVVGGDARDGLRREADLLTALDGLAAKPIELFAEAGNLFLAETMVDGQTLAEWVSERLENSPGEHECVPVDDAVRIAGKLADLVDAVHARGWVLRDLTPSNVIVTPDGDLTLIDPELAVRGGEWASNAYTLGFAAPEQRRAPSFGPACDATVDCFALGAVLFVVATGVRPLFLPDTPPARSHRDRMECVLSHIAMHNATTRVLGPAIRGLTADEPARRWTPTRLREYLHGTPAPADSAPPGPGRQRQLLDDGLAYALAHIDDDGGDRLFPSGDFGSQADPCGVQHGAAGLLAVLTRACAHRAGNDLADTVRRTAAWIDRRRTDVPRLLPGLYFGRSGTAWALYDAARQLGDEAMAERAIALALAIPVRWPNPDICHGAAGAGMMNLYLWQQTKETALRDRLESCVDGLLENATHDGGRVYWRVPADFDSELAGLAQYGFGHGVAGIAAFLLGAGITLGRSDCMDIARKAGDTLVAAAVGQAGGAYWPTSVDGANAADLRYHWSNGSSGVGTFLLRLWQATGEPDYLTLAKRAAIAVRRVRWRSNPSVCHGLAGDGDYLLDLAAVDPEYRDWAEELATCLYARHAIRGGHAVPPDTSGMNVVLDYGTGLTGMLGFVLRLNHGGPRWWMPSPNPEPHDPTDPTTSERKQQS